ncbi:MAG: hypothetical protein ACK2UL_01080 [Anaerolineae bacterium]|jgi:hypothetical protein
MAWVVWRAGGLPASHHALYVLGVAGFYVVALTALGAAAVLATGRVSRRRNE